MTGPSLLWLVVPILRGCGDSGGPLLVSHPNGTKPYPYVQVGVVSWGYGNTYDIYSRVAGHLAWIQETIRTGAALV